MSLVTSAATFKMPMDNCPNCGADLPRRAKACPECGADEKTGWSEEAETGHLNLPEETFDYDRFVKDEFGGEERVKPRNVAWIWWATALVLLILFLLAFVPH
ncbi:MAG: zinc-ribbon domain-containing protein [Opitutaceae bacterium]|nr:zinc-ribbon domain-containing protein [Verrucomicrobiales bacterium]